MNRATSTTGGVPDVRRRRERAWAGSGGSPCRAPASAAAGAPWSWGPRPISSPPKRNPSLARPPAEAAEVCELLSTAITVARHPWSPRTCSSNSWRRWWARRLGRTAPRCRADTRGRRCRARARTPAPLLLIRLFERRTRRRCRSTLGAPWRGGVGASRERQSPAEASTRERALPEAAAGWPRGPLSAGWGRQGCRKVAREPAVATRRRWWGGTTPQSLCLLRESRDRLSVRWHREEE